MIRSYIFLIAYIIFGCIGLYRLALDLRINPYFNTNSQYLRGSEVYSKFN